MLNPLTHDVNAILLIQFQNYSGCGMAYMLKNSSDFSTEIVILSFFNKFDFKVLLHTSRIGPSSKHCNDNKNEKEQKKKRK